MILGVLGLQGAVREHVRSLGRLDVETRVVRRESELAGLEGLVFPGGESTTISLLARGGLLERLRGLAREGFPMFGTCAGMILLANEIEGEAAHIQAIDIAVARNASGRQVDSFETSLHVEDVGDDVPAVFIRAPFITRLGANVRTLAAVDHSPVMARQTNVLVTSFHPELTDDLRIHRYFVGIVLGRQEGGV